MLDLEIGVVIPSKNKDDFKWQIASHCYDFFIKKDDGTMYFHFGHLDPSFMKNLSFITLDEAETIIRNFTAYQKTLYEARRANRYEFVKKGYETFLSDTKNARASFNETCGFVPVL